jgi:hypothetical protein
MLLELKKGADILSGIGGITTADAVQDLMGKKCDKENLDKFKTIRNEEAQLKIANAVSLLQPDKVWFNDGSGADLQYARDMALKQGEEFKLKLVYCQRRRGHFSACQETDSAGSIRLYQEHHGRHHERQNHARFPVEPGARGGQGGHSGHYDNRFFLCRPFGQYAVSRGFQAF